MPDPEPAPGSGLAGPTYKNDAPGLIALERPGALGSILRPRRVVKVPGRAYVELRMSALDAHGEWGCWSIGRGRRTGDMVQVLVVEDAEPHLALWLCRWDLYRMGKCVVGGDSRCTKGDTSVTASSWRFVSDDEVHARQNGFGHDGFLRHVLGGKGGGEVCPRRWLAWASVQCFSTPAQRSDEMEGRARQGFSSRGDCGSHAAASLDPVIERLPFVCNLLSLSIRLKTCPVLHADGTSVEMTACQWDALCLEHPPCPVSATRIRVLPIWQRGEILEMRLGIANWMWFQYTIFWPASHLRMKDCWGRLSLSPKRSAWWS